MDSRRRFLAGAVRGLVGAGLLQCPLFAAARKLLAQAERIIVPHGTRRESLIHRNPGELDTRNLEITPLKEFGTMGPTNHAVDLKAWRLEVTGNVRTPLQMGYSQLLQMPSVEREVLLICPGVFANHGRWKGISPRALLQEAGIKEDATHVTFRGPQSPYEKVVRFPVEDLLSEKVFVAYQVNGEALPQRHGFPLRVVGQDYYGYDWVKYVYNMTVEKIRRE